MLKRKTIFKIFEMAGDYIAIFLIFNISYWLRYKVGLFSYSPHPYSPYFDFAFIVAMFGVMFLNMSDLYNSKKLTERVDLILYVIKAMSLTAALSIITSFLIKGSLTGGIINFSRIVIVTSWLFNIIIIYSLHRLYEIIIIYFRKKGVGLNKVLIIGTGESETYFWNCMTNDKKIGYSPIGFLEDSEVNEKREINGKKILGNINALKELLINQNIDEVVLSNPTIPKEKVLSIKSICDKFETKVTIIPNTYGLVTYPTRIYTIGNVPLFSLEDKILLKYNKLIKRSVDIVVSLFGLVILSPLLLFVSFLVKATSKGPLIYKQERLGIGEKPFKLYKFRTMTRDAEKKIKDVLKFNEVDGPRLKIRKDPRCTKIGYFLRKYSIDELPQLISVIKGDMSLVGPRPCLRSEADQFLVSYMRKFDVKPGITGLWQINGRSDISFERGINLDIYYIENWSFFLDIKILLKTIPVVISHKGSY